MSKQIFRPFEDLRYCPVCKQEFTEPRLIPCGHSFCLKCIKRLKHRSTNNVVCPVCSEVTLIPEAGCDALPHVYAVNQIQTAFEELSHTLKYIMCAVCETKVSIPMRCLQCGEYFCDDCSSKHKSVFKDHILESTADNRSLHKCSRHFSQVVSYFCCQCFEAVCPLCATKHHANTNNHTVTLVEDAKSQLVTQANQTICDFENTIPKVNEALENIEQQLRNEEQKYCVEKCKVEKAAANARSLVSQEEELLLSEIKYRYDHNTNSLENERRNIQSKLQGLDDSVMLAKESLTNLTVDSLLVLEKEQLKATLELSDLVPVEMFSADLNLMEYSFQTLELPRFVGIIDPETPAPDNRIDELKTLPYADEALDPGEEVWSSGESNMSETRIKEIFTSTPNLVNEHLVTSAVDGHSISMVGLGLSDDGAVLCAFNVPGLSQAIISRSSELQQVIFHRRKGISAFAVSPSGKCIVALKNDDHLYLLSLDDLDDTREATCQTHKLSYGKSKSHIQALAFNIEEQIIISDGEKNTVTGFDAQWRRPFNISGNAKGEFSNAASITVGPVGEIIIFDDIKKSLVIFNSDTKYWKSIKLNMLSDSCTIACHSSGVVFVADSKTNCVFRVDINTDRVDELLKDECGNKSPTCIAVKGDLMTVSIKESFSNAKIKVYRITSV